MSDDERLRPTSPEEWAGSERRRPWCCPEPRCRPLHQLKGGDKPLSVPDPGETFLCFGEAPQVTFIYDGVEHVNDVRSCTYTALKGVISFQENADDWLAIQDAYRLALRALWRLRGEDHDPVPAAGEVNPE